MVKINQLEIENVKRIKAVKMELSESGLTVIGGNNNQGKTSVLDSIAWALGGNKYKPSQAEREGTFSPPLINIKLSNGLIVERKGKNSTLKITDPSGKKSGQQLLDLFVEEFAINLPKFINGTTREKADILLEIIGVKDQLLKLEQKEKELYNKRLAIGQIADQKLKYALELTEYPDVPKELISASQLIERQQQILKKNADNQKKRENLSKIAEEEERLRKQIEELTQRHTMILDDLEIAKKSASDLKDESTKELEEDLENIEMTNVKIRANLDKERSMDEAQQYKEQYKNLSGEIDNVRNEKINLLNNASLPLPGLSVDNGELMYNGFKWDNMSGSERLKISTAIVRRLNPECGFVLLDKIEQMDVGTLKEFGEWLEQENLQAIATRVSTGDECSIIIEDGYAIDKKTNDASQTPKKIYKAGVF